MDGEDGLTTVLLAVEDAAGELPPGTLTQR
jgi:hypothetical protein